MRCATTAGGQAIRFPEVADFFVDLSGNEILCHPAKLRRTGDSLRRLVLDFVMPMAFKLRGYEALHAAAVLTPAGACAFVGPPGAGKSTLAATFMALGYSTLSDGCLVLSSGSEIEAIPCHPGVRLRGDAYHAVALKTSSGSHRLRNDGSLRWLRPSSTEQFPSAPQRLVGIYRLLRADAAHPNPGATRRAPLIEPLPTREAFIELAASVFRTDNNDRETLKREFAFLSKVIARVPVRRLWMTNDLSALALASSAVLADLQER